MRLCAQVGGKLDVYRSIGSLLFYLCVPVTTDNRVSITLDNLRLWSLVWPGNRVLGTVLIQEILSLTDLLRYRRDEFFFTRETTNNNLQRHVYKRSSFRSLANLVNAFKRELLRYDLGSMERLFAPPFV